MTGYKVGGQQKSENSWKSTNRPFLVLWSDIWNVSYVELRIWNQVSHDHRTYERNLSNCVEKPEKVRTSTGFEPVTSRYWYDALTNWAMKPLTLGAGHLWLLMSRWRMDVKWYMKCFIYWTADLKSSKAWSSQLWTQFKQLPKEAWKSQDFNRVWTRDLAIPVRRSNQLSYEATDVGSSSFVSSNEPVKNGCEVIYEMFHILNCGFEIKYRIYSCISRPPFSRSKIEFWGKTLQRGLNPWPRDTGATL